jgi:hypothetical protein
MGPLWVNLVFLLRGQTHFLLGLLYISAQGKGEEQGGRGTWKQAKAHVAPFTVSTKRG